MENVGIQTDPTIQKKEFVDELILINNRLAEANKLRMNFFTLARHPMVIIVSVIFTGILSAKIGNVWSFQWFVDVGYIALLAILADFLIKRQRDKNEFQYKSYNKESSTWEDFQSKFEGDDFDLNRAIDRNEAIRLEDLILFVKMGNMINSKLRMELEELRQESEKS